MMKIIPNQNLTYYNSYRIESECKIAYIPENEIELVDIFQKLKGEKFEVLGNGNNIILSKEYYNYPFILLNGGFDNIEVDGVFIKADSGATVQEISKCALQHNLTGSEFLYDIPSSVGGAVIMNAGTKEGETKDILYKVRYLDLNDFFVKEKLKEDMGLSYRNSYFQNNSNCIILKAWFELKQGEYLKIKKLMDESKNRRWSIQPREYPNCGSVFKRPPGKFVGPMLDELGLKGFSIGGAQVSEKHSGFIINRGNASGEDILNLVKEIQRRVLDKFGIRLEVEQRII